MDVSESDNGDDDQTQNVQYLKVNIEHNSDDENCINNDNGNYISRDDNNDTSYDSCSWTSVVRYEKTAMKWGVGTTIGMNTDTFQFQAQNYKS